VERNTSDTVSIPRSEYIAHLAQIADFHINRGVSVFEASAFLKRLRDEPLPPQLPGKQPSLWFAQIFIVVALGKLSIVKNASSFGPPGVEEFLQCIKLLPSTLTWERENPLMLIETFCLLSIYAQAADLHNVAYLHASFHAHICQ
jgi:hypothetical protein